MMPNADRRAAFSILLAALASGCSDGAYRLGELVDIDERDAPAEPSDVRRLGLCSERADLELVDDMEDEDGSIDLTEGRAGVWFAFNDESGTQVPRLATELFPMDPVDPPRDESFFAAHTYGSGFDEWGAGIGFELRVQQPYDASRYAGIALWARVERGASSLLRLDVTDRNTSPFGGVCDVEADLCHDNFGADLELDTHWKWFSFEWDELEQRGWSGELLERIDSSALYGVRFQTAPSEEFDFWIDDVVFLCPER
ncbi:MAG TPA: hypothetical protein VF989_00910 [Polyangiaceae bacterium]